MVSTADLLAAPLEELLAEARRLRAGPLVTYSPKVFIPLTTLCRDVCGYCTFARPPRRGERAFMTEDEVLAIARAGAAAGCHEALFTLGDKPELRYKVAREELRALGCETTLEYLERCARLVLEETGLLPHLNPGVMTRAELEALRPVSASMGIMLETTAERLGAKGGPHWASPDKIPARRLETIRLAGELAIPFTSGILIGIGETREERIDALLALKALGEEHGHVQEVIVQNFRAKPGTRMASHPEPSLDDHLWTIAVARILLGPGWHVQAPPNLAFDDFPRLLDAGIDDWGGVSPVTIDHVNPEAPWPELERLAEATRSRGLELAPRLPAVPRVRRRARALGRSGRAALRAAARPTRPGSRATTRGRPASRSACRSSSAATRLPLELSGAELGEDEITRLLEARGEEAARVYATADALRREVCGDEVTYVVTRNIQYTNVCYFRCGFCAFSKGKLAANLRGAPYLVPREEIVRRAQEAWDRGATEVCLQGGIHPAFTGDYYADVVRAIKQAVPEIHVHAFSALEVWQGAATLDLSLEQYLGAPSRPRARVAAGDGRRGARRRGASRHLPRQGDDRAVARRPRRGAPRRPALERDAHVRARRHAALVGAALPACTRATAALARVHGVRPAAVRPDGGADLPPGTRATRADVPRDAARPRGRAARAASGDHEHPGVVGEARAGRDAAGARRRSERPRRDADERVDLALRRRRVRAGAAAGAHGGAHPLGRSCPAAAHDAVRAMRPRSACARRSARSRSPSRSTRR